MGMPTSVFKPHRRGSISKRASVSSRSGAETDEEETPPRGGAPLVRRLSTGTLGVMASMEADRRGMTQEEALAASGAVPPTEEKEDRGRVKRKSKSRSRPTSRGTSSQGRSTSRGSGDEEERARRAERIRLSRPGGTGMVTLPDGRRVRARRVDDPLPEDEPEFEDWGFGTVGSYYAREIRRGSAPSLGGYGAGETEAEAEQPEGANRPESALGEQGEQGEDGDGSGMARVRRRRRESNEMEKREREAQHMAGHGQQATRIRDDLGEEKAVDEGASIGRDDSERNDTDRPAFGNKSDTAQAVTPPSPSLGLALSPDQADEVRRRHEQEVAALGAEMVSSARASSASPDSRPPADKYTQDLVLAEREALSGLENAQILDTEPALSAASPGRAPHLTISVSQPGLESSDGPEAISTDVRGRSMVSAVHMRSSRSFSPITTKTARPMFDPSISLPAPSPWLPVQPGVRGRIVVPLPQLGRRPARPREGRVWADDASNDSDESESEEMDPEEEAEEERRSAMQKSRATTRAAGQEVLRAKKHSSHGPRSTSQADACKVLSSSPVKARGRLRSRASVAVMQSAGDGAESDDSDDSTLWPRSLVSSIGMGAGAAAQAAAAAREKKARAVRMAKLARRQANDQAGDDEDLWPQSLRGSLF